MRARSQIPHNLRRNSLESGNLNVLEPYLRLFQRHISPPPTDWPPGSSPAGLQLSPALTVLHYILVHLLCSYPLHIAT